MDDLRDKVLQEIDELRAFADSDIHPIVSPDNWDVYSELCDLIDEVKESFLSMPEAHEPNNHDWINVKNRTPKQPPDRIDEHGQKWFTPVVRVIVCDEKRKIYEASYSFQNKEFYWKDTDHPIKVTHWMPLPELPKGLCENE